MFQQIRNALRRLKRGFRSAEFLTEHEEGVGEFIVPNTAPSRPTLRIVPPLDVSGEWTAKPFHTIDQA